MPATMTHTSSLPPISLPSGITSRFVDTSPHSLNFHILEAGHSPDQSRPLILLVHGFPELAYSWRHTMPLLASAGYYVVAFDQRGYVSYLISPEQVLVLVRGCFTGFWPHRRPGNLA
jgi:dipeptidyl aminopeptidase/acylaminoacyl peptidase